MDGAIPSGTVTLVFTDVQGSTRLWEAEPAAMAQALRRHDEVLRTAIEQACGYVFKTVGDAFCAAFETPQQAVSAVLTAQQDLQAEPWPTHRPLRVRMGMHTGVCEERDGDYFGPVVNRTARLEAIADGGQVLVSSATAELLSDTLPDGVTLRDLGLHRLKDLGRPEQVFQLEADFLDSEHPPLASLDNPELPNNLPSVLSAFIGRQRELAEVRALAGSSRLVTLTGAGGSGKTRLALQAAAELLQRDMDGVWLAELAPVTDGEQIPRVLAAVLGLHDVSGRSSVELVIEALGAQRALIILDNCEHVIDAAAKFCDQVIRACPGVSFLATSREPLGIDGERVYRVPSLSLPLAEADADEIAACDAVALFVARARAVDPDFAIDDESVAALAASICVRLDGIPLALELAAARLSSMSLRHLSERLDQRFRLLTGGSRNAMPRQQTLQATVDWSFGLLSQPEREALCRLSVFVGGFELEAAEAICAGSGIDVFDVLDLLGSLVDKSLVVADRIGDSVRYRLLETIRQYSLQELLKSAGEDGVTGTRDLHAGFYLALAEAAAPDLNGPRQGSWLRRLDLEWDNLRAALGYLVEAGRSQDVLRLCVSVHFFLISRLHLEVLDLLRDAIEQASDQPGPVLASAMLGATELLGIVQQTDRTKRIPARDLAERGLALARELGDARLEARALGGLSALAFYQDDPAAHELAEQAVAIARGAGDPCLLGLMLGSLAITLDSDEERQPVRLEALECFRRAGDELLAATELHSLYGLDLHAREFDSAYDLLTSAISQVEQLGDQVFLFFFRSDLSLLLLIMDRHAEAVPVVRHCLLTARRVGMLLDVAQVLLAAACCATWQGHSVEAARLHGAADIDMHTALANKTINFCEPERELQQRELALARERLGEERYLQEYEAGTRLTRYQAVQLALSLPARAAVPES
jgi:predicted ATPase/class 3 adenylate cyclase